MLWVKGVLFHFSKIASLSIGLIKTPIYKGFSLFQFLAQDLMIEFIGDWNCICYFRNLFTRKEKDRWLSEFRLTVGGRLQMGY